MPRVPRRDWRRGDGLPDEGRCLFPKCPLGSIAMTQKTGLRRLPERPERVRLDALALEGTHDAVGQSPIERRAGYMQPQTLPVEHVDGMRIVLVDSGVMPGSARRDVGVRKQRVPDVRNCLCVISLVVTACCVLDWVTCAPSWW